MPNKNYLLHNYLLPIPRTPTPKTKPRALHPHKPRQPPTIAPRITLRDALPIIPNYLLVAPSATIVLSASITIPIAIDLFSFHGMTIAFRPFACEESA
ncbi:hypothetical protein BDV23DRAFT_151639 [Aspergillus alliaceus]|uniref:Uncharacterized protein n=1 Tax=Petromyces alliaceus TaxID=209559 RepID=A0A5N7CDB5_PETAA|nr:uncharacterized protein BDW43DRAFT_271927 [Aspergillus alliaceus]KAB8234930.1 hypothetical protein BDW43DRAFT_271927 [Aspergillus alliaceus]KAE8392145.1 hypothetical protein BDV23DRAFT_151639 [Aspergillus alliaceus]